MFSFFSNMRRGFLAPFFVPLYFNSNMLFDYKITLEHDNGFISLVTPASNEKKAIQQVLEAESAPIAALTDSECLGPTYRNFDQDCFEKLNF